MSDTKQNVFSDPSPTGMADSKSTVPTGTFASPAGPPPPPPAYIKDVSMSDPSTYNSDLPLLALCRQKGISPYFATQITRLREYSSVRLLLDDSGSMKSMINIYGQRAGMTRWGLLQAMVKEIFDLMSIARGREPIDVHFLNMLPHGMKVDRVEQVSLSQSLKLTFSSLRTLPKAPMGPRPP
jgi:hypothetical protein